MMDYDAEQMMPPQPRAGWLARAVGAALEWGRRNPVSAGWLGACAFILILVYVQALAAMLEGRRHDGGGDGGDGGHGLDVPPSVPPDPVRAPASEPAPAPVSEPAPAPAPAPANDGEPPS